MPPQELLAKTLPRVKLSIRLTEDRLKLFISAAAGDEIKKFLADSAQAEATKQSPPSWPPLTRDELLLHIRDAVNLEFIDRGVLDDIVARLNRGEKSEDRRIARGLEPGAGVNGKVVFLVKILDGSRAPLVHEKGFTDFREVHLFDNVKVGQEIARVYPPRRGKEGRDALGRSLPGLIGQEAVFAVSDSVSIQAPKNPELKYQSLIAAKDGYVTLIDGKITVKDELVIKQNLDYRTGNINFAGRVVIRGDVLRGFHIKATQGIEVQGAVRGATLISTAGDINIKGMVFGDRDSTLISAASIYITSGQEVRAAARRNISIAKEARDCLFKVFGSVLADKARIIGGSIYTPCGVQAKEIGSELEKETKIYLCTDVETTPEYAETIRQIESHRQAQELLDLHLGPFAKHPDRIPFLQNDHRMKMEQLHNKLETIKVSLLNLEERKVALQAKGKSANKLRVNFLESLHPAAKIISQDQSFSPNEALKGPATLEFNSAENNFEIRELSPLDLSLVDRKQSSTNNDVKPTTEGEK